MKKINIYILLFLVSILFQACETDLNTSPTNQVSEDVPFKSIEGAQTVLNGTYSMVAGGVYSHYLNQYIFYVPDLMGEDVYVSSTGNYNRFLDMYQYTMIPSGTPTSDIWADSYQLINNANVILDNLPSLPESVERNQIEGQARVLRAYAYHYLIRLYAKPYNIDPNAPGVVLRVKSSYNGIPRSSVKDAYTLIEDDLLKAYSLLDYSSDKAYLDKRAVEAMLARVYLDMGAEKRADAIKYAELAVSGMTLMDQQTYPTQTFSNTNSETIWAYVSNQTETKFYLSIPSFYFYAEGGKYVNGKLVYTGVVEGYSSFRVSQNLVDKFEDTDVRKKFFPYIDGTTEYLNRNGDLYTTKFRSIDGSLGVGAINYLRASEMYLIVAEAAADDGDYAKAKIALNTVREARGASPYIGTNSGLQDAIQLERRKELFGEGHRIFDIKRRGLPMSRSIDGKLMQGQWSDKNLPANSPKFEYPIPQKEIDANLSLSNKDQNPGY